ncbi:hypothetical protein [Granulicella sp. S156]|uniref:hypothetical protein n=1 Tax=Granulicella sp. S156 TaxID=1747224 RepID=UPI00131B1D02|nr:hypothetical protein [Granulicella sp. S156]
MPENSTRRNVLLKAAAVATAITAAPSSLSAFQAGAAPVRDTKTNEPPNALKTKASEGAAHSSQRMNDLRSKAAAAQQRSDAARASKKPLASHGKGWADVQSRAKSLYGADSTVLGGALHPATSIEESFRFAPVDEDLTFRLQQAESLINSSADLLERALASRKEWNDLQGNAFSVGLSIQQYLELDAIHDDETAAGYYTHTAIEAAALADADSLSRDDVLEQYQELGQLVANYFDNSTIEEQSGTTQLQAWLSKLADYDNQWQNTNPSSYTWNGKTDLASNLEQSAATTSSYHNLYLAQANLINIQAATLRGGVAVGAKSRASASKMNWEEVNIGFRQRRTEVARRLSEASIASYTQPGGALNYRERMKRLELLFHRDFRDALARLKVGVDGLSKLYGYDEPLPNEVTAAIRGEKVSPGVYDLSLLWVRNAIAFLVKFGQVDQGYAHTISLKKLLGEDRFRAGRKPTPWASWTFEIPRELFPDQYYLRLRGVTLYVVPEGGLLSGERSEGVWMGSIKAPDVSFCEHLKPKTGAVERRDLDQRKTPSSMAGRISYRQSLRAPELIGGSNLYNISPFGVWTIRLSPSASDGVMIDKLADVVIDMQLAMRMRS